MIITGIKKINTRKFAFDIDGEYAFFLTAQDLMALDLFRKVRDVLGNESEASELNIEISDGAVNSIVREIVLPRGKRYAAELLGGREYTEKSMSDKLKQTGYCEEHAAIILAYLKEKHFISDERYALTQLRFGVNAKSKRKLTEKLRLKGVSEEIIESAFMQVEEELNLQETSTEELGLKQIRKYLDKKLPDEALSDRDRVQKAVAALVRQGYGYGLIKQALAERKE